MQYLQVSDLRPRMNPKPMPEPGLSLVWASMGEDQKPIIVNGMPSSARDVVRVPKISELGIPRGKAIRPSWPDTNIVDSKSKDVQFVLQALGTKAIIGRSWADRTALFPSSVALPLPHDPDTSTEPRDNTGAQGRTSSFSDIFSMPKAWEPVARAASDPPLVLDGNFTDVKHAAKKIDAFMPHLARSNVHGSNLPASQNAPLIWQASDTVMVPASDSKPGANSEVGSMLGSLTSYKSMAPPSILPTYECKPRRGRPRNIESQGPRQPGCITVVAEVRALEKSLEVKETLLSELTADQNTIRQYNRLLMTQV